MATPLGPGPLAARLGHRGPAVAYAASLIAVVLCAAGAVGLVLRQPWLFPSLGPTVMILFESPRSPAARLRNVLVGHGVGLVAGIACLAAFGLTDAPSAVAGGLTVPHVLAGALSVVVTAAVLIALRTPHPPAGATTLIVSLGILHEPVQLLSMAGAIVLVGLLGTVLNRVLLGRPGADAGAGRGRPAPRGPA